MGIGRKIARNQARKAVGDLGEAVKALSNLEQVKNLNELLGLVRQVVPRLIETQQACAGLIQEKVDLERKLERDRVVTLGLISFLSKTQPELVLAKFQDLSDQWDLDNPPPAVSPNGSSGQTGAAIGLMADVEPVSDVSTAPPVPSL